MGYVVEAFADKKDGSFMFTAYFKDEPDLLLAFDNVIITEDDEGIKIEYDITGSFKKDAEEKPLEYIHARSKELLEAFFESLVPKE